MPTLHIRPMDDDEFDPANLDPGIRAVVVRLRAEGFDTCDSGDGFTKDSDDRAFDVPHVICRVERDHFFSERDRLAECLPDWQVEAVYNGDACLLQALDVSL